ncbi:4Fe-4S binding protein [candidate division KSB1 bacterium]|nr:4Fe-4S binding protein [candidate division KSB1 bacterium]
MSIYIDEDKCNGCGKRKESMCERICPGNLLLRNGNGKASISDQGACWVCAACVKVCPMHAIELRLPLQIGGNGSSLKARVSKGETIWQLKYSNGRIEEFRIKSWIDRDKQGCPVLINEHSDK